MYKEWSFFHATINNLQMALLTADMGSAKEYLELVKDPAVAKRIFGNIVDEYERSKKALLQVTGNELLLDNSPNIKESVHLRNPYVDPLNYLQVDLIRQLRETSNPPEDLVTDVLLTINGLAAG